MTVNELNQLKQRVETAKSNYDKAVGKLEAVKEQRVKAGYATLEDLKAELERLQKSHTDLKLKLESSVSEFKEKYKDLLK